MSAPWWCWVLLSPTAGSTPARPGTWRERSPARLSWWCAQVQPARSPWPCIAGLPPAPCSTLTAPLLPPAQPAADATMEEDALHKARRLTDYYDVHEEIGRYGARRSSEDSRHPPAMVLGHLPAGTSAYPSFSAMGRSSLPPPHPTATLQGGFLLPAESDGEEQPPGLCSQVRPWQDQGQAVSTPGAAHPLTARS